jgi:hypothetical protein
VIVNALILVEVGSVFQLEQAPLIAGGATHAESLCPQERLQFGQRFVGCALLHSVASRQGFAADLGGALPPHRQHVERFPHISIRGPQSQQRASDLVVQVGLVMLQIDGGSGAVILAHAVHSGGIAETAQVLLLGFRSAPAHVKAKTYFTHPVLC